MTRGKHAARAANHRAEEISRLSAMTIAQCKERIQQLEREVMLEKIQIQDLNSRVLFEVEHLADDRVAEVRAELADLQREHQELKDQLKEKQDAYDANFSRFCKFLQRRLGLNRYEALELVLGIIKEDEANMRAVLADKSINKMQNKELGAKMERALRPRTTLDNLRKQWREDDARETEPSGPDADLEVGHA